MGDVVLSITKIQTYLNCPKQFKYQYVDLAEWEFTSANMVFGDVIHKTIAKYLTDNRYSGVLPEDVAIDFERRWKAAVEETQNIRFTSLSFEDLLDRGKFLIHEFYDYTEEAGIVPDEIELPFEVPLLNRFTGEYAEVQVRGHIDWIANKTIYELKTASKSYSQAQADLSMQLSWYAYAYDFIYGEPPEDLKLIVLIKTKVPKLQVISTRRTRKDFDNLLEMMRGVKDGVEKGIFPPNPVSIWGCTNCHFQTQCWGRSLTAQEEGDPTSSS